jgi:hypothetical protein
MEDKEIDVLSLPNSPFAFKEGGCVWNGQRFKEGDCIDSIALGMAGTHAICTHGRWVLEPGPKCPDKK